MANGSLIAHEDIVIVENLTLTEYEENLCRLISENTHNTWQKNRPLEGILSDTILGKLAEKAIKAFLCKESYGGFNPLIAFYDDFRTDDLKSHNSIDFIFGKNIHGLLKAQKYIQTEMANCSHDNKEASTHRTFLEKCGVMIGEVKATRIADRHRSNGNVDGDIILRDDFLAYPIHLRTTKSVFDTQGYLDYVTDKYNLSVEQIKQETLNSIADWQFRVYIDSNAGINSAYIVGCLPKYKFIDPIKIKKMPKANKSEFALYLSHPLVNGCSVKKFREEFVTPLNYRNHLISAQNGNDLSHLFSVRKPPKP